MIEQTAHELTPIVAIRPACRALGAFAGDDLPAAASSCAKTAPGAAAPARALSEGDGGRARRAALGAVR